MEAETAEFCLISFSGMGFDFPAPLDFFCWPDILDVLLLGGGNELSNAVRMFGEYQRGKHGSS